MKKAYQDRVPPVFGHLEKTGLNYARSWTGKHEK